MRKEYAPIAMRCNQEQFDKIKPKLVEAGISTEFVYDGFISYPWLLTNYLGDPKMVGNETKPRGRKKYKTWNEQIFLEACGIKTKNDMKLSKEFIKANADKTLKEVFPEICAPVLEVGKWYKSQKGAIVFCEKANTSESICGYGFTWSGKWINDDQSFVSEYWIEATNEEIFEALKNEAARRYKKGDTVKCLYDDREPVLSGNDVFENKGICNVDVFFQVWMNVSPSRNACVFKDGQWATIIPIKEMTQSDIENELGYKIKII